VVYGLTESHRQAGQDAQAASPAEDESEQLGIILRQMPYGRRPGVFRILFSIEGDSVTLPYVRHSAQGPIGSD